jgi:hypothetical protein
MAPKTPFTNMTAESGDDPRGYLVAPTSLLLSVFGSTYVPDATVFVPSLAEDPRVSFPLPPPLSDVSQLSTTALSLIANAVPQWYAL